MPGYSFSLPAGVSCGKIATIAEKCKYCYARKGRYMFKNVRQPREENLKLLLENPEKAGKILGIKIGYLSLEENYFRFFDSGDFLDENIALAVTIACEEAVEINPNIKIWIPTTNWYRPELQKYFVRLRQIENVTLRPSLFEILRENTKFSLLPDREIFAAPCVVTELKDPNLVKQAGFELCEATYLRNNCGTCRKCWEAKDISIAYLKH